MAKVPENEDLEIEFDDEDEPQITATAKVTENDDGSADVELNDGEDAVEREFMDNLAEQFDQHDLKALATKLCELVNDDREARKRRDEQYEEGLRRSGLGNDAPGGAGFNGASKVVHPMLAESCVDFASRAIKEIFPPSGPVKSALMGNEGGDREALAQRKVKFLNWQLTEEIPEYRDELEQIFSQLPMGGSQYQIFYWDENLGRAATDFVPIDDVFLPYSAKSFYTSNRVTRVLHLTKLDYDKRVENGTYREIANLTLPGDVPEVSATESANQKIEGKEDTGAYNEDGVRNVFEIYVWEAFDEDSHTDGKVAPYIISVDEYSEEIVSIYRNWEEGDEKRRKLDWMIEWKFIPWRGAYAIGFPHLIGGLSGAATGSLRALLDSAHINNTASLVKLKGGKTSGQNIDVEPTQVAEVEGPAGTDDIRKVIMPMPYNQPSPVLFELLGWLTAAAKGVIATAEEKMDNVGDRTPVGTTQAMIEQGSQVYSAIHARLHYSQQRALKIICRINATYMDEERVVEELGDLMMSREDFTNSRDICPVSDPHIFSESQRYAQMQGVAQLIQLYPEQKWDRNAAARRSLDRMKIPNYDELLPATPKPENMNPAAENVAAMHGQPVLALPKQNHLAHIFTHVEFALNPIFANPILGTKMMPILLQHLNEHIGFYYADLMAMESRFDDDVLQMPTKELEQRMAHANVSVLQRMQMDFQGIMPKLQQIQQMAQQFAPPPPMDPAIKATYDVGMAQVNAQKEAKMKELEIEQQIKLQIQPAIDKQKLENDRIKNTQDNQQKHVTELMKNNNDNVTKQWIEAMKLGQANEMQMYQSKLDQQENEANRAQTMDIAKLNSQTKQTNATMQSGGSTELTDPNAQPPAEMEESEVTPEQFNAIMQSNQQTGQAVAQLAQMMGQLIQTIQAPNQVIRDPSGRVVGVQKVQQMVGNPQQQPKVGM